MSGCEAAGGHERSLATEASAPSCQAQRLRSGDEPCDVEPAPSPVSAKFNELFFVFETYLIMNNVLRGLRGRAPPVMRRGCCGACVGLAPVAPRLSCQAHRLRSDGPSVRRGAGTQQAQRQPYM